MTDDTYFTGTNPCLRVVACNKDFHQPLDNGCVSLNISRLGDRMKLSESYDWEMFQQFLDNPPSDESVGSSIQSTNSSSPPQTRKRSATRTSRSSEKGQGPSSESRTLVVEEQGLQRPPSVNTRSKSKADRGPTDTHLLAPLQSRIGQGSPSTPSVRRPSVVGRQYNHTLQSLPPRSARPTKEGASRGQGSRRGIPTAKGRLQSSQTLQRQSPYNTRRLTSTGSVPLISAPTLMKSAPSTPSHRSTASAPSGMASGSRRSTTVRRRTPGAETTALLTLI